jgi:hypothetical protein
MRFVRFRFAWSLLIGSMLAHAACAATNGEPSPGEIYTPPDAEAEEPLTYPDAEPAKASDAGVDRKAVDATPEASAPAPSSADVRIQELYVDHDGLGDGAEYVELRGVEGTPVDDLSLRLIDSAGKVAYEVPVADTGAKIGSSGTWAIGPATVGARLGVFERIDRTVTLGGWGLANERGAVQLVRGNAKTLLDVVGYVSSPDAGAAPPPSTDPKATTEGLPAVVPIVAKRALGRRPNAADGDANRTDFCAMPPSPGSGQQKPCD